MLRSKNVRVVSGLGTTPVLTLLAACLFATIGSQGIAQSEVLPAPRLKSFKFAGQDLLKKDAIYTIPRGMEFELEIHAEPGSFPAFRDGGVLYVLGERSDGLKIVIQSTTYKIKRLAGVEVLTAKIKIPEPTPPYVAEIADKTNG